jgi:hypothetical protein
MNSSDSTLNNHWQSLLTFGGGLSNTTRGWLAWGVHGHGRADTFDGDDGRLLVVGSDRYTLVRFRDVTQRNF